ncbi:inositol monophosphatase family protein [soil metagenome]
MSELEDTSIERVASTGPLSPEYINNSMQVVQDFFRSKRAELLQFYGKNEGVTTKQDGSLVTPKDAETEQQLKDLLRFMDPNIGFAGEETAAEGNTETYWVIDPIDSTRSFINGEPYCTNMAALIHNGKVICSIIYEFAREPPVMFTATEGKAMVDGQTISVDLASVEPTVWIDCKNEDLRNELYDKTKENSLTRSELEPPNGYRLSQFAQGNLGIQVCHIANAGPYDLIPGLFIAQQTGAIVRNIGSEEWNPEILEVIAYWPQYEAEAKKIEEELAV